MATAATRRTSSTHAVGRLSGSRRLVELDALAREAGLHPELVRRLIRLGAVEPSARHAAARLARVARLRRDLGLNYAGAILACELLARIEELEAR
jgi:MerR HTH family regulatory protein